jgi:hypothetical protein
VGVRVLLLYTTTATQAESWNIHCDEEVQPFQLFPALTAIITQLTHQPDQQ